jgi:hypothetical protein
LDSKLDGCLKRVANAIVPLDGIGFEYYAIRHLWKVNQTGALERTRNAIVPSGIGFNYLAFRQIYMEN